MTPPVQTSSDIQTASLWNWENGRGFIRDICQRRKQTAGRTNRVSCWMLLKVICAAGRRRRLKGRVHMKMMLLAQEYFCSLNTISAVDKSEHFSPDRGKKGLCKAMTPAVTDTTGRCVNPTWSKLSATFSSLSTPRLSFINTVWPTQGNNYYHYLRV